MPIESNPKTSKHRWIKMVKGKRYWSRFVFLRKWDAAEAEARWWAEYQTNGEPPDPAMFEPQIETGTGLLLPLIIDVLNTRLDYLKQHGSNRHYKDTESIFTRAMRLGSF